MTRNDIQFMLEIRPITREFVNGRPVVRTDETGRPAVIVITGKTFSHSGGKRRVGPIR